MKTFHEIIDSFGSNFNSQIVFNEAERQFSLKPFKLKKFSIKKTIVNYIEITKKYQNGQIDIWKDEWHKNQRKLFIQFLICYCKIYATSPQSMSDVEWNNLSIIFFKKTPMFLKFQGFSIMKNFKKVNWTKSDDDLIRNSIKLYGQGNWNQISKGVFFGTNHSKFFSPKQIRQRWFNHISQNINRGNWSAQQDLLILEHVLKNNKRWCEIVKLFEHTRTEHMIKNRYKFLIKQTSSNRPTKQLRVVAMIINKLKKKVQSTNLPIKLNTNKQISDKNSVNCSNASQSQMILKHQEGRIKLNHGEQIDAEFGKEVADKVERSIQNNQISTRYNSFSPNMFGFIIPVLPDNSFVYSNCFMDASATLSPSSPQIFYSPSCMLSPNINNCAPNSFSTSMNFWQPFQGPTLTSVIEANAYQENQQLD